MRSKLVFTILLVASVMTVFATSDALPQTVASHFRGDGLANGWMSRDAYVVFMLGLAMGVPLFAVLAVGWAPRREFLREHAYRLGSILVLFLLGVHLLVLDANSVRPPRLAGGLLVLLMVLLVGALALWTLALRRRLSRPR